MSKKSKKSPKKPKFAPSMKAAASVCGLEVRTVQAAKDAGCPAIKQSGRVHCPGLLAWLEDHPEVLDVADERLRKDAELIKKIRAERLLKENQLKIQRGEWVSKAISRQVFSQFVLSSKARSFNSVVRIVTLARVAASTSDAIQEVRKEIEQVWRALESGEWYKKHVCPKCGYTAPEEPADQPTTTK